MPAIPASFNRRLRGLRDATLPMFELPERRLAKRYRRGGWTAREVLVHIADTESVLLDRLRRVAAQEKPLLLGFDPDAWTSRLDYAGRDLALARALYLAARSTIAELVERHRGDAARMGIHSEAGLLSLAQIAEKVAWHNQHHIEQIRSAVGP
jgi:hypothetical protein